MSMTQMIEMIETARTEFENAISEKTFSICTTLWRRNKPFRDWYVNPVSLSSKQQSDAEYEALLIDHFYNVLTTKRVFICSTFFDESKKLAPLLQKMHRDITNQKSMQDSVNLLVKALQIQESAVEKCNTFTDFYLKFVDSPIVISNTISLIQAIMGESVNVGEVAKFRVNLLEQRLQELQTVQTVDCSETSKKRKNTEPDNLLHINKKSKSFEPLEKPSPTYPKNSCSHYPYTVSQKDLFFSIKEEKMDISQPFFDVQHETPCILKYVEKIECDNAEMDSRTIQLVNNYFFFSEKFANQEEVYEQFIESSLFY